MRIINRRITNTEITYSVQGTDPRGGKYVKNRFHYFSKLIRGIFMLRREQDSDQPCPNARRTLATGFAIARYEFVSFYLMLTRMDAQKIIRDNGGSECSL